MPRSASADATSSRDTPMPSAKRSHSSAWLSLPCSSSHRLSRICWRTAVSAGSSVERREVARHGRLERVVLARVLLQRLHGQRALGPLGVERVLEQMALVDHLVEPVKDVHPGDSFSPRSAAGAESNCAAIERFDSCPTATTSRSSAAASSACQRRRIPGRRRTARRAVRARSRSPGRRLAATRARSSIRSIHCSRSSTASRCAMYRDLRGHRLSSCRPNPRDCSCSAPTRTRSTDAAGSISQHSPDLAPADPRSLPRCSRSSLPWQPISWRVELATGYPVAPAAATNAFAARAQRAGATIEVGDAAQVVIDSGRAVGVRLASGKALTRARSWSRPARGRRASCPVGRRGRRSARFGASSSVSPCPARRGRCSKSWESIGRVHSPTSCSAWLRRPGHERRLDVPEPAAGTRRPRGRHPGARRTLSCPRSARRADHRRPLVRASVSLSTARPLIGAVPDLAGVFVCAGHGPWGISTGPASARLVVDEMLGRASVSGDLARGTVCRLGRATAEEREQPGNNNEGADQRDDRKDGYWILGDLDFRHRGGG